MPLNKIEKSKIKTNSKLILKKNKNLFNKTKIQIGNYLLAPGKNLFPLKNSNDFLKNEDYKNIKEKIDRDGYFYLKNFFDKKTIETARKKIFVFLANSNLAKKLNFGKNIAVLNDENKEGFTVQMISGKETKEKPNFDTEKWKDLCQSKELKKIYDGLSLNGLLKSVFGNIKMLSDQSWLRLIGRNGATQEHADYYYFKNESVFNIFAKEIKKERIGNFGFGKENCFVCRKSTKETEFRKCALCAKLSHLDCLDGERKNSLSKKRFWLYLRTQKFQKCKYHKILPTKANSIAKNVHLRFLALTLVGFVWAKNINRQTAFSESAQNPKIWQTLICHNSENKFRLDSTKILFGKSLLKWKVAILSFSTLRLFMARRSTRLAT
ncbi:hypothetical protein MHBO_000860 [Bonamia ostreae]|uniref:Uncharacterized protein n=1 Tax=Bonamia ostreae TaxID=126728 RepID=A0ABV2AH31_9EUKA